VDTSKRIQRHHADDKVEDPVARGSQGHSLTAAADGKDLRGEKPGHRAPGEAVYYVIEHNEGVLAVGFDCDAQVGLMPGICMETDSKQPIIANPRPAGTLEHRLSPDLNSNDWSHHFSSYTRSDGRETEYSTGSGSVLVAKSIVLAKSPLGSGHSNVESGAHKSTKGGL
jgi:hypothetical protein